MACTEWLEQLDSFLDGELATERLRAVDAHLRACPSCAGEAVQRMYLKRAVRTAGQAFVARPEFRKSLQKSIATQNVPRVRSRIAAWNWRWAIPVLALILIAAVEATNYAVHQLRREQTYSELADLHVGALASSTPVDVLSTDRHTVKPWFQGKIPFSFNLPELQNSDFSLLGGRVTYLEQTPGAHLVYLLRGHRISVFIFQADRLPATLSAELSATRKKSFNMETWSQDGLRYFVVGDAGMEDIQKLSTILKKVG